MRIDHARSPVYSDHDDERYSGITNDNSEIVVFRPLPAFAAMVGRWNTWGLVKNDPNFFLGVAKWIVRTH